MPYMAMACPQDGKRYSQKNTHKGSGYMYHNKCIVSKIEAYTHTYIHTYTQHTHTVRVPTVTLLNVPTGVVVGQELTITCMATVDATITLMVVYSSGMNVYLTEVETTANSRSVNITAASTGLYTVTCMADNGLNDTTIEQFSAISKLWLEYSYMYSGASLW